MKTAALLIVALACLFGCAEADDRAFEDVAEVIQPNDEKICECQIRYQGDGGDPIAVCYDQFCDPCLDQCQRPDGDHGGPRSWTCNSLASDFEQFNNWGLCEYPEG